MRAGEAVVVLRRRLAQAARAGVRLAPGDVAAVLDLVDDGGAEGGGSAVENSLASAGEDLADLCRLLDDGSQALGLAECASASVDHAAAALAGDRDFGRRHEIARAAGLASALRDASPAPNPKRVRELAGRIVELLSPAAVGGVDVEQGVRETAGMPRGAHHRDRGDPPPGVGRPGS